MTVAHSLIRSVTGAALIALTASTPSFAAEADNLVETSLLNEQETTEKRPWLGLMLDAGVPDGANLSLVYRPFHWLRFHAGPSYNLVSVGVRGGVSLIPFDEWISPSLVVEGGHFFPAQLSGFVEGVLGLSSDGLPEWAQYSYANVHLGLEFGSPDFVFYLRGGYSFIDAYLTPSSSPGDGVRLEGDAHVTAFAPSAKLGFVIYLL